MKNYCDPNDSEDDEKESFENSSGAPFSVLMQQAATLKQKQQETFRRKYDSWPSWYQHTMFSSPDIILVRNGSFEDMKLCALNYKVKGNNLLKKLEFYEALTDYEKSLSVFQWVENTAENWTKKEIDDTFLVEHKYEPKDDDEKNEIKAIQLACYLNLSILFQKLKQWQDCILSCNYALQIDDRNVKAYYRRAQARLLPASCGAAENEIALKDLKRAHEIDPSNALVKETYVQLKRELDAQRKKDMASFGGLFERDGGIILEGDSALDPGKGVGEEQSKDGKGGGMTVEQALQNLKDAECAAERFRTEGDLLKAKELRAVVAKNRTAIEDYIKEKKQEEQSRQKEVLGEIDFCNPPPEVLEHARLCGLDLSDPKVQAHIVEMHKEVNRQKQLVGHSADKEEVLASAVEEIQKKRAAGLVDILVQGLSAKDVEDMIATRLSSSTSTGAGLLGTFVPDAAEHLTGLERLRSMLMQDVLRSEKLTDLENSDDGSKGPSAEDEEKFTQKITGLLLAYGVDLDKENKSFMQGFGGFSNKAAWVGIAVAVILFISNIIGLIRKGKAIYSVPHTPASEQGRNDFDPIQEF